MPSGAKPKVFPARLVARVRKLYAAGSTQHEIATALGLTQKIIWNLMRRHGIKARLAAKRDQWGENNASWKGDKAGKQAFHRRLYALHGKPKKCSKCGTVKAKIFDYANLTGKYEDLNDYAPMCRSCHAKYDSKALNFQAQNRKVS